MARVLVVDDDREILESCVRKLELEGHLVTAFDNPLQALQHLKTTRRPFDCAIVDLLMPGMDGRSFLEEARRVDPQMVAIAMTALATVDAANTSARSGARFFLTKPVRTKDLLRCVERAAQRSRTSRETQRLTEESHLGFFALDAARIDAHAVLDNLSDGILVVARDGRLVYSNPAAVSMLGAFLAEQKPAHYGEVMGHPALYDLISDSLSGRDEDVRMREAEIAVEDRTYRVQLVRLPAPGGGSSGIVVSLHDISETRRIQQVRSRFVTLAAKELRDPLTSLEGYVNLFLESGIPLSEEKRLTVLARLRERLADMRKLVDGLVTFNRMRTDWVESRRERVDLAVILEDAITEAITQRGDRDIALRRGYTGETAHVLGDPDALVRMFAEVIGNAFKFNRDGGEVRVTLFRGEKDHEVAVTDTGIGIPEDALPTIFDEFVRVKDPSTVGIKGSGLGLAIARRIAESHMARIQVSTTLGQGSTFRVFLRAADADQAPASGARRAG